MAMLPRVITPSTEPAPLPVPRLGGAGPEAFGAGLGEGISAAAQATQQIVRYEQDRQDAIRATAWSRQLDDLEHSLLYDPTTGALNTRGVNTLPIHDATLQSFDQQTDEIAKTLTSERQRNLFARMAQQRRGPIGDQLDHHTASEMDQYDGQETQGAAETAIRAAGDNYDNVARVEQEMARGSGILQSYAMRQGLGPDATAAKVAQFRASLTTGVIERALANQKAVYAGEFLKAHGEDLTPEARARLEEAVNQGTTLQQVFAATDAITRTSANRDEALAKVRDIQDPEVRQRAQQEVDQFYNEQNAAHREAQNTLFDQWSAKLEDVRSINKLQSLMGTDWKKISQDDREALTRRAKQLQDGANERDDSAAWTKFMLLDAPGMAAVNPMRDLRPYLTDSHYNQALQEIQMAKRASRGDPSALADMSNTIDFNNQITEVARQLKVLPTDVLAKPSDDQANRFTAFSTVAKNRLSTFQLQIGRKATQQERQQVLDNMQLEQVKLNHWWPRSDTPFPAGAALPGDDLVGGVTRLRVDKGVMPPAAYEAALRAGYTDEDMRAQGWAIP